MRTSCAGLSRVVGDLYRQPAAGGRYAKGGGFGVLASLASMLEFQAYGIEIERELVDASQQLADDFDLPVEFVHGSFIPPGGDVYADEAFSKHDSDTCWLVTDEASAYPELGLDPDDFEVIFAYPWPGEEDVVEELFARYAADGALLLTYSRLDSMRLQRKVRGKSRRRHRPHAR